MDLATATTKIADVTEKLDTYKQAIEKIKVDYIVKINTILNDLETVLNKAAYKGTVWATPKVEKLTKKLQDTIDNLNNKLKTMYEEIERWYNKTVNKIKISVVKGSCAKIGLPTTDDIVNPLAQSIPHPALDTFLSIPPLDIELPDMSNLTNIGKITLPRIEI